MADDYTLLESMTEQKMDPVFTSKQWAYQADQNQGSYASKQITFDLSGFFNSARFLNPQEMFLALPVLVGLSALPAATNAGTADGLGSTPTPPSFVPGTNFGQVTDQFAFGLKSGYWNLIDSLQVQVDGKDVIQTIPHVNYHASFVANTSFSHSDVDKYGPIIGFRPDESSSWKYQPIAGTDASRFGWGITNNSLVEESAVTDSPLAPMLGFYPPGLQASTGSASTANKGFLERMRSTNQVNLSDYVVTNAGAPVADSTSSSLYSKNVAPVAAFGQDCLEPHLRIPTIHQSLPFVGGANQAVWPWAGAQVGGADPQYPTAAGLSEDTNSSTSFRQLRLVAIIRMKDICNLFAKLPLTRGLYVRMIVNVNTGYVVLPTSGGASAPPAAAADVGLLAAADSHVGHYAAVSGAMNYENSFSNTCPIMIAPLIDSMFNAHTAAAAGNACAATAPAAADFMIYKNLMTQPGVAVDCGSARRRGLVLSCSLAQPDAIHQTRGLNPGLMLEHPLKQCRMYCPVIDLDPLQTSRYLTDHKVQSVFYKDILAYTPGSVPAGQPFQYQLGNGIVNAQKLIIIPFYENTALIAGSQAPQIPFEPLSPFDSAPATCAPRSCLKNFNVLVSNINVFQRNIDYSFENFMEEVALTNALNGGLDTGMTSGLIDYAKWKDNYRYYVVDLSRRIQGDNTPKSLSIMGTNGSNLPLTMWCFVEYRRHLEINVETGHVAVSSN